MFDAEPPSEKMTPSRNSESATSPRHRAGTHGDGMPPAVPCRGVRDDLEYGHSVGTTPHLGMPQTRGDTRRRGECSRGRPEAAPVLRSSSLPAPTTVARDALAGAAPVAVRAVGAVGRTPSLCWPIAAPASIGARAALRRIDGETRHWEWSDPSTRRTQSSIRRRAMLMGGGIAGRSFAANHDASAISASSHTISPPA